jgi:hypothetical protein
VPYVLDVLLKVAKIDVLNVSGKIRLKMREQGGKNTGKYGHWEEGLLSHFEPLL